MSNHANTLFLEQMQTKFAEAMGNKNEQEAWGVVAEVKQSGFADEGETMAYEILGTDFYEDDMATALDLSKEYKEMQMA